MSSLLKTSGNGGCKLDCLPFDVLVSILQSPLLDIHSIMLFAELWPHYDSLVTHVLRYHHLPRLSLQSAMDQEGKRQYHSWFYFHSLDIANRRVTFMVQPSGTIHSKRYISNTSTAARPHLRHITLYHQTSSHPPPSSSPPTPTTTPTSSSSSADLLDKACSASLSSSCSLSSSQQACPDTITNKPLSPDLHTTSTNMIQSHPLSLKHGFHTLSTRSCRHYQQKIKQTQRSSTSIDKDKWQFSYRVSYTNDPQQNLMLLEDDNDKKSTRKIKTEHMYLSPICLTVSLSTLRAATTTTCRLEQQHSSSSSSWFEKYVKSKLFFL